MEPRLAGEHADRQHGAQRVLGARVDGGRPRQVTALPRSKPNINTSLSDIIKFVQDKYVKKKYADPNEPLDPLKRAKMGLPQNTKEQPVPVKPKEQAKGPVQGKSAVPAQKESPFAIFDSIASEKRRRKSSDNLISF